MNLLLSRIAMLIILAAVSGCSSIKGVKSTVNGWMGNGNTPVDRQVESTIKYAASLRVVNYLDQRNYHNPRYLGEITSQVNGMTGHELLMDQDIALIATDAIKRRFSAEGFQVLDGALATNALFEVGGIIKELTLNVKNRDYISIVIITTLKDVASGKVIWQGQVIEKNDRFAGVSGNDKEDVMAYLNKELRIAGGKTVEAISASLVAAHPELFNLTPGARLVPGLTVFVAPPLAKIEPPQRQNEISTYHPHASDTNGLLLVNTNPPRAKVYLDDVYYGLSPLRLEIEPGIHALSVKLTGYNMIDEKVSIRRGDNTEVELTLEH
jgi:hypothetical protein